MLVQDEGVREVLRRVVCSVSGETTLQDDLMQEALIHLWKMETTKPRRTLSWYLQSCWFHLHHWLAAGRSVDSPKRSIAENRLPIDESLTPDLDTNGEAFDRVCFDDLLLTLRNLVPHREIPVLDGLAHGLGLREICTVAHLSYPTALKYRRHLAAIVGTLDHAAVMSAVGARERDLTKGRSPVATVTAQRTVKGSPPGKLPAALTTELRQHRLAAFRTRFMSSARS
jgi:DNA-directed RNA polymerase specialized sigma24 family protein